MNKKEKIHVAISLELRDLYLKLEKKLGILFFYYDYFSHKLQIAKTEMALLALFQELSGKDW